MSKLTNDENATATPCYYDNASSKKKNKKKGKTEWGKEENTKKVVLLRMILILQNGLEWQQILYFHHRRHCYRGLGWLQMNGARENT